MPHFWGGLAPRLIAPNLHVIAAPLAWSLVVRNGGAQLNQERALSVMRRQVYAHGGMIAHAPEMAGGSHVTFISSSQNMAAADDVWCVFICKYL